MERRQQEILRALVVLLICANVAVVILAMTLSPRLGYFASEAGNPISWFLNSRDMSNVPGVGLASMVLSIGVYWFVRACLSLRA